MFCLKWLPVNCIDLVIRHTFNTTMNMTKVRYNDSKRVFKFALFNKLRKIAVNVAVFLKSLIPFIYLQHVSHVQSVMVMLTFWSSVNIVNARLIRFNSFIFELYSTIFSVYQNKDLWVFYKNKYHIYILSSLKLQNQYIFP